MKANLFRVVLLALTPTLAIAEDNAGTDRPAARDAKLAEYLSGSRFVGQFTVIGREDAELPREEYTIKKVEKIPGGDIFVITARIQYGDKDVEVPMPIPIVWAGSTPVMVLDDLTIPGLGTFSAKVVIDKGRYAGTS